MAKQTRQKSRNVLDILGIAPVEISLYDTGGALAFAHERPETVAVPDADVPAGNVPDAVRELMSGRAGRLPEQWVRLEAETLSLAGGFDQLMAVHSARTVLEPYQVECVARVIKAWRQRFLIADDVGLGKTIEAGMIFRELDARGRADKVLIVCPAPLAWQWKEELVDRFGAEFDVFDGAVVSRLKKELPENRSPWEVRNRIIASIDYVKQKRVLAELQHTHWDLVIVDEAHRMSVSSSNGKLRATQRYRLGEMLSSQSEAMLLLTATPHRGDRAAFLKLMALLDPVRFSEDAGDISPDKIAEMLIRRGKGELKDASGKPVFRKRHVKVVPVTFSEAEWRVYSGVTDYTRDGYNRAQSNGNMAGRFAMLLLQRRMASSIHALRRSLARRIQKLESLTTDARKLKRLSSRRVPVFVDESDTGLDDRHLPYECDPVSRTLKELATEIEEVRALLRAAEKLTVDSKAATLRAFVDGIFEKDPNEKLLIFTEFYDTLIYLKDDILSHYKTGSVYGGMAMPERRAAVEAFRSGETRILLCTDAAGEGLNMQFCHLMINYEMPWNPNRIDQRLGRLHRYGQKRNVTVYHLQVSGTREAMIFDRLQEKIEQIEEDLGGRLSDVLGSLMDTVDFEAMVMESLNAGDDVTVLPEMLDDEIRRRSMMLKSVEQDLMMGLQGFDLAQATAWVHAAENSVYAPNHIRDFVKRATSLAGGTCRRVAGERHLFRIVPPPELSGISGVPGEAFVAVFDPKHALSVSGDVTFIAHGTPYLTALIRYWRRDRSLTRSAIGVHDSISRPRVRFAFTVRILATGENGADVIREDAFDIWLEDNGGETTALKPGTIRPAGEPGLFASASIRSRLPALYADARTMADRHVERLLETTRESRRETFTQRLDELSRHFENKTRRLEEKRAQFKASLKAGAGVELHIKRIEKELTRTHDQWRVRYRELQARMAVEADPPSMTGVTIVLPKR